MFGILGDVMRRRAGSPELHAGAATTVAWSGDDAVFCLVRSGARGVLAAFANVSPEARTVAAVRLEELGLGTTSEDRLTGRRIDGDLVLAPYDVVWLVPG